MPRAGAAGPVVAWSVLRKDLLLDLRTRDRLGHMAVFALLVVALLSITLPDSPRAAEAWVPALLWIVVLLTSVLGLARSFESEAEAGAIVLLAHVPCDRGWIFAGKAAASWLALLGVALWTALLMTVFLDVDWSPAGWHGAAVCALGTLGIAAVGTLLASMSMLLRFRALLLPVLLFPLLLPVLVLASRLTGDALAGFDSPRQWWGALGLFDQVFVLLGFLVFDYVLED